jgi:hypothetical protein
MVSRAYAMLVSLGVEGEVSLTLVGFKVLDHYYNNQWKVTPRKDGRVKSQILKIIWRSQLLKV